MKYIYAIDFDDDQEDDNASIHDGNLNPTSKFKSNQQRIQNSIKNGQRQNPTTDRTNGLSSVERLNLNKGQSNTSSTYPLRDIGNGKSSPTLSASSSRV